jgi:hypothetical protein
MIAHPGAERRASDNDDCVGWVWLPLSALPEDDHRRHHAQECDHADLGRFVRTLQSPAARRDEMAEPRGEPGLTSW